MSKQTTNRHCFGKLTRLLCINGLTFAALVVSIELLLGRWLTTVPGDSIPSLFPGKRFIKYVNNLYEGKGTISVSIQKDGYPTTDPNWRKNQLPIILTIGGSTTSEDMIGDGDTWQDIIAKESNETLAILNGGISGQSILGHYYSIKKWHSKELTNKNQPEVVLFYVGVNDGFLLKKIPSLETIESRSYSNARHYKIRQTLLKRSFFYSRLVTLRNNSRAWLSLDSSNWRKRTKTREASSRIGTIGWKPPSIANATNKKFLPVRGEDSISYQGVVKKLIRATRM